MAKDKRTDIYEANRRISRPAGKADTARAGKVMAGQRAEYAANPTGGEGSQESETEEVLKRASRDANRR